MAELKGDKEKQDGLEITSIGSLYTGPWDKKYWSSSRGKGRYPYPVGYEAVRAHNGSTYKMEIHEGPKGPMFIISTADGHSSSGQTPDIAWEKFQKKYCPHVKIWHGKRFSCNIDGVEFFGFKNSFVQRLLREIVANVSGTIEKNLLSSSFCKEGPKADHISSHPDAQAHHDLLPLDRSQIIGKRSRRLKIVNTKSSNNANLKRSRSQALANVAEASNRIEENQRIIATGSPLPSFKGKCDDNEQPTIVPRSVSHISESDLPLNLVDISNNLRNIVPSEETRLVVRSRNCASTNLAGKLLTEEKYLDRLQGTEVEDFISPMSLEVKNGEHPGLRDDQVANDVVLYVPDTSDLVQDDTADNGPSVQDKRESTAADMIISEGLVSETDPEEERGTSNSNGSSQKSDFDSVGQETAKSMMSFLLPQAVPLLKKSSRKKKAAVSSSEIMPFGENTPELNKKTNVSSPAVLVTENKMVDLKERMNVQITNLHSADAENIVTLDNLRDQIYGEHASYHEILPSFDAKADQVRFNDKAYPCNACGQSIGIGEESDCFLENSESKDIFCYDEVHMDPSGMLHQGDVISKSMPSSTVPFNNDCAEEIRDACHSAGRLRSSNISPEESCVKNVVDNCSKTSTEVPRLVYSRRREQVKAITQIKGKYNFPLSESIICSNVEDNHVSETCPSRNPIALETVEMGSSDEKSHTKDLGLGELIGCYLHPLPVLSLLVCTTGEDIHICVLCGLRVNKDRTLFIYKIATQEPRVGYPSFVGHTSVTLPSLKDYFGKEIALERSGLQYTPGGQYLVLLDCIRTPYCRQGTIPCLCPACASGSFEEDAVKIVEVKLGYVSVVVKLKTLESLQCVLVCEPNHLVAVGESGRLHLWVMNPAWSAQTEQFILPANDLVSPGIVELKRIPKCVRLVVGHNGFGEFSLWDISKRILVSKFSTSCTSFSEFFPVALFGWKKKGHSFGDCNVHGHVNRMMAATNMWFSEQTNDDSLPLLEEEIAVWLLVSVPSDSDDHHDYTSGDYHTKSVGWWRLALLVKNMVILGGALDPSAEAIGASAGHGIIGTCDGLVYIWEMSTGTKLGTLHHFRGSSVSCIATDDSKKGAVAISGGEGQLLVYLLSQNNKPN
ncbi:uncharacterized protein LOC21409112 [Morus notabilis]|uniref:uncharacterized protein LOC21409112 n=1 Tax=Morus notabilis TaxID=981085 RepID=UPI000CECEE8D|nr:uncharacterized protein LOC21409112 [Morus notabilis]